jgi:hypothetical protein
MFPTAVAAGLPSIQKVNEKELAFVFSTPNVSCFLIIHTNFFREKFFYFVEKLPFVSKAVCLTKFVLPKMLCCKRCRLASLPLQRQVFVKKRLEFRGLHMATLTDKRSSHSGRIRRLKHHDFFDFYPKFFSL